MNSHNPTEVYAARDEIDATLVQSMLAESAIEARVVGGQITGAVGEVPAGLPSAPRVWVADKDAAEATKLIRIMEEKRRKTWQLNTQADNEPVARRAPSPGREFLSFLLNKCCPFNLRTNSPRDVNLNSA